MSNNRPYTYQILSEKIQRPVSKGEMGLFPIDRALIYAWPGIFNFFEQVLDGELGSYYPVRDKIRVTLDHMCPVRDQAQGDFISGSRAWCEREGLLYAEDEGIGHNLAIEKGWVEPGMLVAHFDTHVSSVGAVGALGFGSGTEMLFPLATGKVWLKVPPVFKVKLAGKLPPGVMGRDVLHRLVKELGTTAAGGMVVEYYCGETSGLTPDDKITACNLINYIGAMSAVFVPPGRECGDGAYDGVLELDLAKLEPILVCPPATNNAQSLARVLGKKIDLGIVGTCCGGGLEDLAAAARILKGNKVKKGVKLYVCPSSNAIFSEAAERGYVLDLVAAGAFISSPTCDFCYGRSVYLLSGQTAVSTQTLNVPGRLGSLDAEIYLGSPAVVAYSALKGELADPREFYRRGGVQNGL